MITKRSFGIICIDCLVAIFTARHTKWLTAIGAGTCNTINSVVTGGTRNIGSKSLVYARFVHPQTGGGLTFSIRCFSLNSADLTFFAVRVRGVAGGASFCLRANITPTIVALDQLGHFRLPPMVVGPLRELLHHTQQVMCEPHNPVEATMKQPVSHAYNCQNSGRPCLRFICASSVHMTSPISKTKSL